jgi:hypothetical protein
MRDDFKPYLQEWISILSVSSRYDMDNIRQRAIREIDSHRPRVDPINKIVLAEQHNIPGWLAPAYACVCQRAHPLEEWEAEKLGMTVTVKLARAREAVRELPLRPSSPQSAADHFWGQTPVETESLGVADYEPYDCREVQRIIDEVFWPKGREKKGGRENNIQQ